MGKLKEPEETPDILELEHIPLILERAINVINKEITVLAAKQALDPEDSRNLIAYCGLLGTIYRDYRSEVKAIEQELRGRTKADVLAIAHADGKPKK